MRRIKPIHIIIFVVCFAMGVANSLNSRKASSSTVLPTPQTTLVAIPQSPPKGWTRLEGKGVAMQLPDTFIGGSIQDYYERVSRLAPNELSPQANAILQEALKDPDQFVMLAISKAPENNQQNTVMNVTKTRFSDQPIPLETLRQDVIQQYPSDFEIFESAVVKINDLEVIRMVTLEKAQSVSTKQLQYIRIDNNNDAWIANYSSSPNTFDQWLPIFEQSYQSFELLPVSK